MMTQPFQTSVSSNRYVVTVLAIFLGMAGMAHGQAPANAAGSGIRTAQPGDGLVNLAGHIPGIIVDIPYATADNFLKRAVYPANIAFLRRSVAERLALVQAELQTKGLGLKILDAYRPLPVQSLMWKIMPDSRYVADPAKGSRHNRAAAVDVTLVDKSGKELEMPTKFDDFTPKAHVKSLVPAVPAQNREILQSLMTKHGFLSMPTEWWHFDAPDWQRYPLLDIDLDKAGQAGTTIPEPAPPSDRRLESRIEVLEKEVQSLRRKLAELEAKSTAAPTEPVLEIQGRPVGN